MQTIHEQHWAQTAFYKPAILEELHKYVWPTTRILEGLGIQALIAGGALRDILLGKEVKDIDVFLNGGEEIETDYNPDGRGYGEDSDVLDYFSVKHTTNQNNEIEIQFVKLRYNYTYQQILARFDLGICQIALDWSTGNIITTDAFWQDVANETITLIREPRCPGDEEHIQRIKNKYKEYTYVDGVQGTTD